MFWVVNRYKCKKSISNIAIKTLINETLNFFLLLFRICGRGRNLDFMSEVRHGNVGRGVVPAFRRSSRRPEFAGRRFAGRNAAFGNSSPAEKGIRNSGIRIRQGGPSLPLECPLRRDAIVCAKTHKYFWPCSFCRCVCMRFGGRASGSISCSGPKFQPEGRARKERVLFPPHPSRSRYVRMSRNVRSG